MKTCVVTANFACDPAKAWLYLTRPTLNGWCPGTTGYDEEPGGERAVEHCADGQDIVYTFTRREKNRCLSGSFAKGKVSGAFTLILMGGGDSTSIECTLDVSGLGLFAKPQKMVEARLDALRKALGE